MKMKLQGKRKCILLILLSLVCNYCIATDKDDKWHLFLIQENGKYGYIDSNGNVVIQPQFYEAGDFSEGLANVRKEGTYGYIDKSGHFAIPPIYDYAEPFSEGLAFVYTEGGKLHVIDKKGNYPFDMPIKDNVTWATSFANGFARIGTDSRHSGAISKTGKLVFDTLWRACEIMGNGQFIISKCDTDCENCTTALIGRKGHFIIPFGKYSVLYENKKMFWACNSRLNSGGRRVYDHYLINGNGKELFKFEHEASRPYSIGNFHCGFAKVELRDMNVNNSSEKRQENREGFIDTLGRLAFPGLSFLEVSEFNENRAFVIDTSYQLHIIDTKGKIVNDRPLSKNHGSNWFYHGKALVIENSQWEIIDSDAHVIKTLGNYNEIKVTQFGDYFMFKKRNHYPHSINTLTGIMDSNGRIIYPDTIGAFDVENGFQHNLLACFVSDKLSYIDKNGKLIWQQKQDHTEKIDDVSLDHMAESHFEGRDHTSMNREPLKITSESNFPEGQLSVVVKTDVIDTFEKYYAGLPVFIANQSKNGVVFKQNGYLKIVVQAKDKKGEWRNIQYNYHAEYFEGISLPSGFYWKYEMPKYKGNFKTKLRLKLTNVYTTDTFNTEILVNDLNERNNLTIYSNEFEGSINTAQLWRKGVAAEYIVKYMGRYMGTIE